MQEIVESVVKIKVENVDAALTAVNEIGFPVVFFKNGEEDLRIAYNKTEFYCLAKEIMEDEAINSDTFELAELSKAA